MLLVLSSEDCCRSFSNPRIERYELTATAVPGEICLVTAAGEPVTWQCVSCSLSKTCPKSFETKAYNGRAVNLICSHFWMDTVQIATIRWQTAIKKTKFMELTCSLPRLLSLKLLPLHSSLCPVAITERLSSRIVACIQVLVIIRQCLSGYFLFTTRACSPSFSSPLTTSHEHLPQEFTIPYAQDVLLMKGFVPRKKLFSLFSN